MNKMRFQLPPRRQLAYKCGTGPPTRFPVTFEEDMAKKPSEKGASKSQDQDDISEGKFSFRVEKLSQLANDLEYKKNESEFKCIQWMAWQIIVETGCPDKDGPQYFEVKLKCEPMETKFGKWTCEASVTFKILPQTEGIAKKKRRIGKSSSSMDGVRQFKHIFCKKDPIYTTEYKNVKELMDPANGWYDSATDSITIEAVVKAEIPCGAGMDLQEQFLSSIGRGLKLFESGDFSDCVVQFVDPMDSKKNKDFHVHKFVLASRSEIFGAILLNGDKGTGKCHESRVQIMNSTARAVHQMLHFMYAGKLPADLKREDANELLVLARRYQIKHLALASEEYLVGSLTLENVCDSLVCADRHNAHSLRIACEGMIRDNMDTVKQQAKWAALKKSSPDLVIRVLEEFH